MELRNDPAELARLPMQEQVLDRLADLLYDAHELRLMLQDEAALTVRWIEPVINQIYDDVSEIMNTIAN